jgi:hypothetical protein
MFVEVKKRLKEANLVLILFINVNLVDIILFFEITIYPIVELRNNFIKGKFCKDKMEKYTLCVFEGEPLFSLSGRVTDQTENGASYLRDPKSYLSNRGFYRVGEIGTGMNGSQMDQTIYEKPLRGNVEEMNQRIGAVTVLSDNSSPGSIEVRVLQRHEGPELRHLGLEF